MPRAATLSAPQAILLRGVFCVWILAVIFSAGCKESPKRTPLWESASPEKHAPATPAQVHPSTEEITLMVCNLRNYLDMPRGKGNELSPKPDAQIQLIVSHIKDVSPQLIGMCEIGGEKELRDLQSRLRAEGLNYPHSHLTTGSDQQRQLAILSQLPLKRHSVSDLTYQMAGHTHKVSRGILDVSLQLPSGPVRLLGVHLKSKRPSPYWDQELVRRHEARVVRQHVEKVLAEQPQRLLLYGDFNDTKNTSTVRAIKGTHTPAFTLRALELSAADGTKWTHYWEHQDVYARIDFVFTNASMRKSLVTEKSYIYDLPHSHTTASDHRPLVVTFR